MVRAQETYGTWEKIMYMDNGVNKRITNDRHATNEQMKELVRLKQDSINSYCAIGFFRECAPPIRAQIHEKKNNEKTQRRRQQKTVTMTIKDV